MAAVQKMNIDCATEQKRTRVKVWTEIGVCYEQQQQADGAANDSSRRVLEAQTENN